MNARRAHARTALVTRSLPKKVHKKDPSNPDDSSHGAAPMCLATRASSPEKAVSSSCASAGISLYPLDEAFCCRLEGFHSRSCYQREHGLSKYRIVRKSGTSVVDLRILDLEHMSLATVPRESK